MSFFIGNCCLKLNYLICGSKEFSSKKKKLKLRQKTNLYNFNSNNKYINKNYSSPILYYKQYNINPTPLQEQSNFQSTFKYNQNNRIIKHSSYESSLNYSNDDRSYSTLNDQIIIKDVILHRNNRNQRFGLTLSYGITSKSTTNIYIEHVEKSSIGDLQGHLERGDQIIKINNHLVTNRDEAIQIVNQALIIILQIVRFKLFKTNLLPIKSRLTPLTLTEDDSGIILASNTDYQKKTNFIKKKSNSLSCLISNNIDYKKPPYRRCLSLNDLINDSNFDEDIYNSKSYIEELIHSQSFSEIIEDNNKAILKPLPFNYHQQTFIDNHDSGLISDKYKLNENYLYDRRYRRRRYREKRLKEQNDLLITTDDEIMSELKQGKYWTKEQRKKQFQKSKQYKQRSKIFQNYSTADDFNLLNKIFLYENKQDLLDKPYLAKKYKQQSIIEKEKLKKYLQQYSYHHIKSQSSTTLSINSTLYNSSTIII